MLEEELDALTRALAGGVEDVASGASRTPDIPDTIRENKKYATVFKAAHEESFRKAAQQYVNLNTELAAAMTVLSCDCACLSDAVLLTMQISKTVNDASLSDYCHLFDIEHQIAELKRLWELRTKHVSSFAHLSLLLNPRSKHRHFTQNEPLIVGDVEQKTWGNTEFLRSADACIRDMADMVLPDDHKLVLAKIRNDPTLSVVQAKRALLSGALKAFVGVHESKKLKHLGISEERLKEAGSSDCIVLGA
jgi:hypothetical protein